MQNHVSCLQSKAKQLLREQDDVQLQLDVFEGLIAARDAWAGVCKSVLDPEWESDELLQLTMEGADRELQELLRERTHTPEHVLQQLPMLPALSVIDRCVLDTAAGLVTESCVLLLGRTLTRGLKRAGNPNTRSRIALFGCP
jgi:hypothetical protein